MLPGNSSSNPHQAVADTKRNFARFQLAFAAVFVLVSAGFGFLGVIVPRQQMRAAQQWIQTPCVITQSSVVRGTARRRAGKPKRLKYTLTLAYTYQYGGQAYRDTTYSFDDTRLSGYEAAYKVAKELPVGMNTTCWVNPALPSEAVLKRDAQQPAYVMAIPVVLLLAGLAFGANALKTLRAPTS